jgi:hypothetical protein
MAAAATSEQQIFCNFSSTGSASLDEHEHGLVDGAARIREAPDELGDVATGVRRHEVHALPVDVQRQDSELGRLAPPGGFPAFAIGRPWSESVYRWSRLRTRMRTGSPSP